MATRPAILPVCVLLLSAMGLPQIVCRASEPVRAQSTPMQPNIVMLISDDQAWTDYGFMQHPAIKTPHLDRLAERSAVFRRGYVPTALCRPSLMTMISGMYPHQHGITGNDPAVSPASDSKDNSARQYDQLREQLISKVDQVQTLPKILGAAGYVSHQSGKWWEGNFRRGGFTEGMTRGFPEPGGRHGDDGLEIGRRGLEPVFEFVRKSASGNKPFMLWYAPFLPHTPHNPPERILEKYISGDRPLELSKYFAMCEWFDETCGQLLTFLDEQKLTDNTIIVFVCDNGWIQLTPDNKPSAEWKQPFAPRSKQSPYEGGTRTPIMFSWPGHIVPGVRDELASSIDIVPTVLSAVSAEVPSGLPGVSLMPVLRKTGEIGRKELYGESFSHDVADISQPSASLMYRWLIDDHWKLLVCYDAPKDRYSDAHVVYERNPQLFDLREDPAERNNLAGQHPDRVRQMALRLQEIWQVDVPVIGMSAP